MFRVLTKWQSESNTQILGSIVRMCACVYMCVRALMLHLETRHDRLMFRVRVSVRVSVSVTFPSSDSGLALISPILGLGLGVGLRLGLGLALGLPLPLLIQVWL